MNDGKQLIAEAIKEYYGDRCPDYEPGCPACDAWAAFNGLIAAQDDQDHDMTPVASRRDD